GPSRVAGRTPPALPGERGLFPGAWPGAGGLPGLPSSLAASGLDKPGERRRVTHREVRQDLPIERDAGLLEPAHEARIGHPEGPAGGVDPEDPERPELPLLSSAVAVREGKGPEDRFRGRA